jgi:hypothetical protein
MGAAKPRPRWQHERAKGKKSSRSLCDLNERYTKETAGKLGKSERTVQLNVARGEKIKNIADVVGTSLDKGAELDALAKMAPEQQQELIEKAKAGEKVSARQSPAAQSAEDRKALYAAEEGFGIPGGLGSPPSVPAPGEPYDEDWPDLPPPILGGRARKISDEEAMANAISLLKLHIEGGIRQAEKLGRRSEFFARLRKYIDRMEAEAVEPDADGIPEFLQRKQPEAA